MTPVDGDVEVFRIEAEVEGEQTAGVLRDYIETKTHCTLTAFEQEGGQS